MILSPWDRTTPTFARPLNWARMELMPSAMPMGSWKTLSFVYTLYVRYDSLLELGS